MNDDIIVLNEEELIQINGGAIGEATIIGGVVGAEIGAALGPGGAAFGFLAGALITTIGNNLSAINQALGPPGTFNPYSNPIGNEYGY